MVIVICTNTVICQCIGLARASCMDKDVREAAAEPFNGQILIVHCCLLVTTEQQ